MKLAQIEEADGGAMMMMIMLVMITINDFNKMNFAADDGNDND